jgi:hypothetical protein
VYDADTRKGTVVDPTILARKASAPDTPYEPVRGSGGDGSSSGCDAGLGFAPLAILAIGLALYRRRRYLP